MKEKFSVIFIVVIVSLCLFGCGEEMPEEDMVMQSHFEVTIS